MSRRDKTSDSIMDKVNKYSDTIKDVSDNLVAEYCSDLDNVMSGLRELIYSPHSISNEALECYILDLANTLYFTGSAQEDLGVKEDTCRSIRQELYNKVRDNSSGTVADKNALAELAVQQETIVVSIYSRAYKKVKLRMESGYEMLNSLKKIMNKRISEMELSNSRYIGGNRNA